ncbi:hypothetical protein THAOC_25437 [Thalassiosira oceanica]|uniref:Uncharacterized protein n=1 Tax=Thalassiosira oceanica TaxID=159749 RepID=K0RP78_THAOC|nr:hypothetical protein THAOC_25437 [Thalassiosira oceanica]|eukprot:EJK54895.1 hypothetical protein THAOC_25437 [Thalassiosira oceanica]
MCNLATTLVTARSLTKIERAKASKNTGGYDGRVRPPFTSERQPTFTSASETLPTLHTKTHTLNQDEATPEQPSPSTQQLGRYPSSTPSTRSRIEQRSDQEATEPAMGFSIQATSGSSHPGFLALISTTLCHDVLVSPRCHYSLALISTTLCHDVLVSPRCHYSLALIPHFQLYGVSILETEWDFSRATERDLFRDGPAGGSGSAHVLAATLKTPWTRGLALKRLASPRNALPRLGTPCLALKRLGHALKRLGHALKRLVSPRIALTRLATP